MVKTPELAARRACSDSYTRILFLVIARRIIPSEHFLGKCPRDRSLLQLLLGAEGRCVSTSLLATVGRPGMEPGVALAANHLLAVVFLSKKTERRFNDTSPGRPTVARRLVDTHLPSA